LGILLIGFEGEKAMKKSTMKSLFKLSTMSALLVAQASALAIPAAQLSFTPGDKTPEVNTRFLNVGQASHIKTDSSSIKELVFGDGSVLTLGLETEVVIDQQSTMTKIELVNGSLRITSATNQPIIVSSSGCSKNIFSTVDNASAYFESFPNEEFKAAMVYGKKITVANGDQVTEIVKPGFAVKMPLSASGCLLRKPSRLANNELAALLQQTQTNALAIGSLSAAAAGDDSTTGSRDDEAVDVALADDDSTETVENNTEEETTDTTGDGTSGSDPSGDDTSGGSTGGEGTDVAGGSDSTGGDTSGGDTTGGGDMAGGGDTTGVDSSGGDSSGGDMAGTDPITPEPDPLVIPDRGTDVADASASLDGFGPGEVLETVDTVTTTPTQADGDIAISIQTVENIIDPNNIPYTTGPVNYRSPNRTSSAIYNLGAGKTQNVGLNGGPSDIPDPDNLGSTFNLNYAFAVQGSLLSPSQTSASFYLADEIELAGSDTFNGSFSPTGVGTFDVTGPVLFLSMPIELNGNIYTNLQGLITGPDPTVLIGGGPFNGQAQNNILTTGFGLNVVNVFSAYFQRELDNFIFFQSSAVLGDGSLGSETFYFAAGDVDGRLNLAEEDIVFAVDQFHLGSGINVCPNDSVCPHAISISETLEEGIRAFARTETAMGLTLTDTGLLVVNQAAEGVDDQTALLHVDFAWNGEGNNQRSTISTTVGNLFYEQVSANTASFCSRSGITCTESQIRVTADMQTIGSSQGNINFDDDTAVPQRELISFTSPFRLTAAGGSNPNLVRQGYAGYLVLENYDPTPQYIGEAAMLGGTESTIGNSLSSTSNNIDYAQIRLATANGNTGNGSVGDTYTVGTRTNTTLTGWSAGLGVRELDGVAGLTVTQIDSDLDPSNFSLSTDAATNRVTSTINLFNHAPIQLGGLTGDDSKGASAFVDNDNYAATTLSTNTDASVALVSSGLVEAGLPADAIPDYEYIQWGFFFGDTITTPTTREHVHMGTWVAGDETALADLPTMGTASYTGHTIGNVYSGGENYSAIGTFSNSWDFGTRRGTAAMTFDGTAYTGETEIRDSSIVFDGVINGGGREGALHGNFVQGGGDPTAGVTGRFSIQNTSGNPDYRASGTFAGEKD
jgi:hypothetical protein